MNNCTSCGSTIPDGFSSCSMCYGDIDYADARYYREEAWRNYQREQREIDEEYLAALDELTQQTSTDDDDADLPF